MANVGIKIPNELSTMKSEDARDFNLNTQYPTLSCRLAGRTEVYFPGSYETTPGEGSHTEAWVDVVHNLGYYPGVVAYCCQKGTGNANIAGWFAPGGGRSFVSIEKNKVSFGICNAVQSYMGPDKAPDWYEFYYYIFTTFISDEEVRDIFYKEEK